MSSEIQVTGKKYRILTDVTNKVWTVISFVSKAVDTIFNDGKTAEAKLGAIDGITSDLSGESETIAASIKCVNELNSSLVANDNLKFQFATDGEGNYGYLGADDSFIPFKSGTNKITLDNFAVKAWGHTANGERYEAPTITYDENSLTITQYPYTQGAAIFPIDMTNIDVIGIRVLTWENGSYTLCGICDDNFSNMDVQYGSAAGSVQATDKLTFNTARYNGTHYLFIRTHGSFGGAQKLTISKK